MRARLALLALLLAAGAGVIAVLYVSRPEPPLPSTLATPFQILGAPAKLADRALSRVIPVGDLDERELGEALHRRFAGGERAGDRDQAYVDSLMEEVARHAHKPFSYRAYVVSGGEPNAMALPGGVVLVTDELLTTLHSESELVAVLAHETGHIELGHCFDAVRFELLTSKVGADTLGALADFALQLMTGHAYSKTAEHEADDYAYALLRGSQYDPRGVGASFASLSGWLAGHDVPPTRPHADVLRDYFSSHPPLEVRQAEYLARAEDWWRRHPDERRYVGRENLDERAPATERQFDGEWAGPSVS